MFVAFIGKIQKFEGQVSVDNFIFDIGNGCPKEDGFDCVQFVHIDAGGDEGRI